MDEKNNSNTTWIKAGAAVDFPSGEKVELTLKNKLIMILNHPVSGKYYAFEARCPHQSRTLATATLHGNNLRCNWHGMTYDLETGVKTDTAGYIGMPDLEIFPVKIEDGNVFVGF